MITARAIELCRQHWMPVFERGFSLTRLLRALYLAEIERHAEVA